MPMPEAAMDKDYGLARREDDVRSPRQQLRMQGIAEATPVERLAQQQLRLGIFALDPSHHPAAGGRINYVRQSPSVGTPWGPRAR